MFDVNSCALKSALYTCPSVGFSIRLSKPEDQKDIGHYTNTKYLFKSINISADSIIQLSRVYYFKRLKLTKIVLISIYTLIL